MTQPDLSQPDLIEPANLRFLRRLVTILTATMILGVIAIFVLLVIRLQTPTAAFPDVTVLPLGAKIETMTRGPDFLLVVTSAGQVFVLNKDGSKIVKELDIAN